MPVIIFPKNGMIDSISKYSGKYISSNPVCELCERAGKITSTEEIHHIKAVSEGGNNREENLMSLCKSCHSRITAEEGGRWGKNYLS